MKFTRVQIWCMGIVIAGALIYTGLVYLAYYLDNRSIKLSIFVDPEFRGFSKPVAKSANEDSFDDRVWKIQKDGTIEGRDIHPPRWIGTKARWTTKPIQGADRSPVYCVLRGASDFEGSVVFVGTEKSAKAKSIHVDPSDEIVWP